MDDINLILRKVRSVAKASFRNAVRLHEDAVLLYKEDRIPSSFYTSVLSIEEIGKYFMHEEVLWHNRTSEHWPLQDIQEFLRGTYSHVQKQGWFAHQAGYPFSTNPLLKLLDKGRLEQLKQKATYVGLPRQGKNIDFNGRLNTPFRTSKKRTESQITFVNDFVLELALGIRKGTMGLDIPEIDDWLAEESTEEHFVNLWPKRQRSTQKVLTSLRKLEDLER